VALAPGPHSWSRRDDVISSRHFSLGLNIHKNGFHRCILYVVVVFVFVALWTHESGIKENTSSAPEQRRKTGPDLFTLVYFDSFSFIYSFQSNTAHLFSFICFNNLTSSFEVK